MIKEMSNMIKIFDTRQTGKTTKIIKLSSENNWPIIVTDMNRLNYVLKLARDKGVNIPTPITVNDMLNNNAKFFRIDQGVIIDDADQMLSMIIRMKISPMSDIKAISMDMSNKTVEKSNIFDKIYELFKGGKEK